MKVDLKSVVGGQPLAVARDLLRRNLSFTAEHAADVLGIGVDEAEGYLLALTHAGYLERDPRPLTPEPPAVFVPTLLGSALRKARRTKRFGRAEGDQAVAALLSAIQRVNADPDLLAWVEEADLFGGYAAGASDLGDVDVAILLKRRPSEEAWSTASLRRAAEAGRSGSFLTRLMWGDDEIWRALKSASRRLDLQPKEDMVQLGFNLTPLFRRTQS